jgi:PAS domain S-box-containing protein
MINQRTVLLIDEALKNRAMCRSFLEQYERCTYTILEAHSGASAIAFYQQHQIDVIILNSQLPDGSGLEFLQRLEAQECTINSAVIVLIKMNEIEIATDYICHGAQDCLINSHLTPDRLNLAIELAIARLSRHPQQPVTMPSLASVEAALSANLEEQYQELHANLMANQAMLSAMPDLLLRVGRDGTCLSFMPPRKTVLGNWLFIKDNIAEVLPPSSLEKELLCINQALDTGEVQFFEHQLVKHGKVYYEELQISPCGDDEVLIVVRDTSSRKQMELDLQFSEARFRSIFEQAATGISYANQDGYFLKVNQKFCDIVGYSAEELYTLCFQQLTHPDDLESDLAQSQQLLAGEISTFSLEKRYIRKDGLIVWATISISLVFPYSEQMDQPYLLGLIDDISERKQIESDRRRLEIALTELNQELERRVQQRTQQLLQSQEALYRREQEFRTLVENSPDSIIRVDQDLRYLYVNPEVSQDLGIPAPFIIGKTAQELGFDDELLRFWKKSLEKVRRTRRELAIEYEINTVEEPKIYQAQIVPELTPEGDVESFLVVARNITELKQVQAALQEREQILRQANTRLELRVEERTMELKAAKESAEAANRAKSSFLANMSHELRTPLNAILGFSQLLSRDASLSPQQQEQLGIINRSGEHLLNLINDILEMSKIEAGRVTLNPNSFDLYLFLHTLHDLFQLRAQTKGLQFYCQSDASVPQFICADEGKLRQVLINLLGNAIKFTAEGCITLKVSSQQKLMSDKVHPEDAQQAIQLTTEFASQFEEDNSQPPAQCCSVESVLFLVFSVEDTGIGIAETDLDRLFEPFVQAVRHDYHEGTGLGLPISQQFVRLMGGDLRVQSTIDVGSTFEFTIPVTMVESSEVASPNNQRRVTALAPKQPQWRILVVEDQWENRDLLLRLLMSVGFEARAAVDGEEAIAQWQNWHPHLIWMDIQMPVLDGYETTKHIRVQEELARNGAEQQGASSEQQTIIIALTARAFDEDRDRMMAIGCNDFVSKPLQEGVILEKIAQHLGAQYIYEPDIYEPDPAGGTLPKGDMFSSATTSVLQPTALKVMPLTWLTSLHQASMGLDTRQVLDLIQQIPENHSALAYALTERIENFDFEQVINLAYRAITVAQE